MRCIALLPLLCLALAAPPAAARGTEPLNPQLQNAHWIWLKGAETKDGDVYLRKAFDLKAVPTSAVLQISTDDEYKVWINGSRIGETRPKDGDAWRVAELYSVARKLAAGRNTIVIKATNHHGQAGAIATLLMATGAEVATVNTDSSWEAAEDPGSNWEQGTGGGGDWQPCLDLGQAATTPPWFVPRTSSELTKLIERTKPAMHNTIVTPIAAKSGSDSTAPISEIVESGPRAGTMRIRPTASGQKAVVTIDFGKELVGHPVIGGTSAGASKVTVACGEYEAECAAPYISAASTSVGQGAFRWAAPGRFGFRYVRLTIEPEAEMDIDLVQAEVVGSGPRQSGSFTCSDEMLNKVYDTSAYTLQLCMQDFYEDGVKRDRLIWTGDLRVEALVGYYCFGDFSLTRRCLIQLADIQYPDGLIPGAGPNQSSTFLPDYCAYWAMTLADYYRYSGDAATVKLLYPTLRKLMGWFDANSDETGLFRHADRPGWWIFVDWDDSLEKKDRVMAMEALYYWTLKDAVELARVVKNRGDAELWQARADKLRAAINSTLWDEKTGAYVDCVTDDGPSTRVHRQPNAIALLAGVPDADMAATLATTMTTPGSTPSVTTPYMNFYVVSSLFEAGKPRDAVSLMRDYWGAMILRGATTCWEKFDPEWPTPYEQIDLSYCHGWSAGPGMMLPAYVAGIRPMEPGFRMIEVQPELADLAWARATVPTPRGSVKVDWKRDSGCIVGSVELPKGTDGQLLLPAPPEDKTYTVGGKLVRLTQQGGRVALGLRGGRHYVIGLSERRATGQ